MKALVTGATGFVGYSVAKELLDQGYQVRALVRKSNPYLEKLSLEMVSGDLLDVESLKKALAGCDYLFHVAAHYSLWEKDPSIFQRVNVEGTKTLMQAAQEAGIKRVVYTSSVAVLDLSEDASPVDETRQGQLEKMVGEYKRSKFLAEEEVKKLAKQGLPVVIVNPSAPVGPFDIKPTPTGKIIVDFLNRKMPGYLDTGLNLVAVEDVAKGHLLALNKGQQGERYILGAENLTLQQILQKLAKITNLPAPKIKVPYAVAYLSAYSSELWAKFTNTSPGIPLDGVKMAKKYMFFDSSKAKAELGYTPTSVDAALERAVNWFYENNYVS